MTVKQLLDTEEAYPGASEFTIDGAAATQLTLVGQVRAVLPQPTNVTYRIDDGTGTIEVKRWVDADKNEAAEAGAEAATADEARFFALDQHVRVFGRLKLFNQKRYVGAHFLRAIDDYNEVGYHMLECTYVHLCLTRGGVPGANGGAGGGGAGGSHHTGTHGHEDGMFVDQDGGGGYGGGGGAGAGRQFSANGQKVYNFMRNMATGNEGVNVNVIANELKLGYNPTMTAIQELTDAAAIFATVDDETFALM